MYTVYRPNERRRRRRRRREATFDPGKRVRERKEEEERTQGDDDDRGPRSSFLGIFFLPGFLLLLLIVVVIPGFHSLVMQSHEKEEKNKAVGKLKLVISCLDGFIPMLITEKRGKENYFHDYFYGIKIKTLLDLLVCVRLSTTPLLCGNCYILRRRRRRRRRGGGGGTLCVFKLSSAIYTFIIRVMLVRNITTLLEMMMLTHAYRENI